MGILKDTQSLQEMEKLLERKLQSYDEGIRILGDIELTFEDYKLLVKKLEGVKNFQGNLGMLQRFKVCIVTAWVFSLRYEQDGKFTFANIKSVLEVLPQYLVRQMLEIYSVVFEESELIRNFVEVKSFREFYTLLVLHAGIPENEMQDFCNALFDTIGHYDLDYVEEKLHVQVPDYIKQALECMTKEERLEMIRESRNVFVDCYINRRSKKELLVRHPLASRRIIEGCLEWCELQNA